LHEAPRGAVVAQAVRLVDPDAVDYFATVAGDDVEEVEDDRGLLAAGARCSSPGARCASPSSSGARS
jgi:hypothetical protein